MNEQKNLKIGDEIELVIDTLAFGGEGIGRAIINEKPFSIFVEEVVPGDKVKVKIFQKKKNWGRAYLKDILTPSPDRIQPRCKHFGSAFENPGQVNLTKGCGGCTWQFLTYEQQLQFKERQVREAIQHLGGLEKAPVLPIIGMKDPWFYRNKMEFSFSKTMDSKIALGLHLKRRHHDMTELTECFLLAPYVGDLVKEMRQFFQKISDEKKIDGALRLHSLTIREAKNSNEIMLILSAENGEATFLKEFQQFTLDFFARQKLALTSLYFIHINNHTGQKKTTKEELLYGTKTIREQLNLANGQSLQFQISPSAFFQPNTFQAQVLYQKALEAAKLTAKEIVYDLFCGTGTIGIFCASKAKKVYGIELNASAIENAKANAQANNLKNIDFLVGDVDKNLPKLLEKADVIMVDPPRNGLEPKVVEKIIALGPKRIVYVSCNPSTLARDIKLFTQGHYELQHIQPVDMFPQTYHIENVALLEKVQLPV